MFIRERLDDVLKANKNAETVMYTVISTNPIIASMNTSTEPGGPLPNERMKHVKRRSRVKVLRDDVYDVNRWNELERRILYQVGENGEGHVEASLYAEDAMNEWGGRKITKGAHKREIRECTVLCMAAKNVSFS